MAARSTTGKICASSSSPRTRRESGSQINGDHFQIPLRTRAARAMSPIRPTESDVLQSAPALLEFGGGAFAECTDASDQSVCGSRVHVQSMLGL